MDSSQFLPVSESPARPKLNRSMSFSEISPRKQINVSQNIFVSQAGQGILKQYSYHEIDTSSPGSLRYSQKFVSEYHINLVDSDKIPNVAYFGDNFFRKPEVDKFKSSPFKAIEYTSFDHSEKNRKRSHSPSNSEEDMTRKKVFRKMSKKALQIVVDEKGHPRTVTQLLWVIVPLVLAFIATLSSQYFVYQRVCDERLDVNASELLLTSSVFGQEKAMKAIVEILKKFNSSEENGLVVSVLTGATGVGKTYTASLLEEIFPWKHKVHHFIMPLDYELLPQNYVDYFKSFIGTLQIFPFCGDHLVIMDDLTIDDIKEVASIVKYLNNLAAKNKVMAVLIFKFHKQLLSEESSEDYVVSRSQEVHNKLIENNISPVMVEFKMLDKEAVILCIREAFKRHWIPITDDSINKVLNQVDYHSEGCKRISSKIAVVNELWDRDP